MQQIMMNIIIINHDISLHRYVRYLNCHQFKNLVLMKNLDGKPYICPYSGCEKIFERKELFMDNINLHTGANSFKCTISIY